MDEAAIRRATDRIAGAPRRGVETADVEAALARARSQVEALAETAAELGATLPGQVADAVRDGIRAEALPVARQTAEVRGLMNRLVRRLERLETELVAERHARVDDLALLVDLITSGWKGVDLRLARMERKLELGNGNGPGAVVVRMHERSA